MSRRAAGPGRRRATAATLAVLAGPVAGTYSPDMSPVPTWLAAA